MPMSRRLLQHFHSYENFSRAFSFCHRLTENASRGRRCQTRETNQIAKYERTCHPPFSRRHLTTNAAQQNPRLFSRHDCPVGPYLLARYLRSHGFELSAIFCQYFRPWRARSNFSAKLIADHARAHGTSRQSYDVLPTPLPRAVPQ
jgi:hypothetical protein